MAKLYWRGKQAWARDWINGQDVREPLGTTDRAEAPRLFKKWVAEKTLQPAKTGGRASFDNAVDCFFEHHLDTLKKKSKLRYIVSLKALTPHFERMELGKIDKVALAKFVSSRRKQGRSSGTIRRDLACLSSIFSVASDWDLVDVNPVTTFMKKQQKKGLKEAQPRTRYLSHEEEQLILDEALRQLKAEEQSGHSKRALTKIMILAAIIIAIDSGLRDEELLNLDRAQVDISKSEITVLAKHSKTNKERKVPIMERSLAIIRKLPRPPTTNHQLLIWHRNCVRFYDLNHTLQKLGAKVGVRAIRWHDLRRTCGCRLLQDHEMPIERVSLWLGHSTVEQTRRAYAFLDVRHLHAALAKSSTVSSTVALLGQAKTGDVEQ